MTKTVTQIKAEGAVVREASFRTLRADMEKHGAKDSKILDLIMEGIELYWDIGFAVGAGLASGASPEDFARNDPGNDFLVEQLKKIIH
jgi:hypothetical protein